MNHVNNKNIVISTSLMFLFLGQIIAAEDNLYGKLSGNVKGSSNEALAVVHAYNNDNCLLYTSDAADE